MHDPRSFRPRFGSSAQRLIARATRPAQAHPAGLQPAAVLSAMADWWNCPAPPWRLSCPPSAAAHPWRAPRTKAGYRKEPITCWHCNQRTYWGRKWCGNRKCKSNCTPAWEPAASEPAASEPAASEERKEEKDEAAEPVVVVGGPQGSKTKEKEEEGEKEEGAEKMRRPLPRQVPLTRTRTARTRRRGATRAEAAARGGQVNWPACMWAWLVSSIC